MPLLKTIETLTRGAVGVAAGAVRHPVATTAHAVGLAKGAAEAGVGLARTTISGRVPRPRSEEPGPEAAAEPVAEAVAEPIAEPETAPAAPEIDLPGPDLVETPVPTADDLPEPVVIEADDEPQESFHHEPHATTRAETIGHEAGDVFEAEDEADEALEEISGQEPTPEEDRSPI